MSEDTVLARPDALPVHDENALHEPYFTALRRALSALCVFYHADEKTNDYETLSLAEYFHRLVFTFEALEMKYSYRHDIHNDSWVNILGSGLPTFMSIMEMSADLASRESQLAKFPSQKMLLQLSLDYMFKTGEEPDAILWQLAAIQYLTMLEEQKLYLPFSGRVPEFEKEDAASGQRTYQVAWECYDAITNRPYINLLKFHQDMNVEQLEKSEKNLAEVQKTIAGCGSRSSDVGLVVCSIDEAIEWLHPKYLKRIGLGPFYMKAALDVSDKERREAPHHAVYEALSKYGTDEDYMFFFNLEVVFSQSQSVTKGGLLNKNKVREVLWLPEADLESYKRHASLFEPHVLLPHSMLQSLMQDPLADAIPLFRRAKKITYDERGVIHVFN